MDAVQRAATTALRTIDRARRRRLGHVKSSRSNKESSTKSRGQRNRRASRLLRRAARRRSNSARAATTRNRAAVVTSSVLRVGSSTRWRAPLAGVDSFSTREARMHERDRDRASDFYLRSGGAERDRTDDLLSAIPTLPRLSYSPTFARRHALDRPPPAGDYRRERGF